jgi:hypothetical protein
MGFNRRKMGDQRRQAAEKEAATRRATDAQVLEDAEHLIAAWNERQAKRMPMLFSERLLPRDIAFCWVQCPAWSDQDARSTLTTLNRGSRSTWISKTRPSGQVGSARSSATVFAVTATLLSISTPMLSR